MATTARRPDQCWTQPAQAAARRSGGRLAARCRARWRRKAAASAPKRPPTSTPITTRRARRALLSSGYVWRRRRRLRLPVPRDRTATTSMQRASLTGTSMFMSASLTLRATRALLSRQTRASGRARDANTPDVAQAERWSPSGSRRPRQRQVRGVRGSGRRSRRRRSTRRCSGGRVTAADVGRTVRARPCESSNAGDAALR